jgi:DNA-binding CsgD family transcriptional regulator
MTAVAQSELRQVVDVLEAGRGPQPEGRLSGDVLSALHAAVPSDCVSFADMDVSSCTHYALDDYDGAGTSYLEEPETAPDLPFWQHYPGSRFCSYPTDTGDDKTVTMRADFFSRREWQQTAMYADLAAADGITDEMMCPLASRGSRSRRLLFFRSGGPDFDERDRLVLSLLRPHLAEMVSASAPAYAERLTPRQVELMRLVAAGHSNAEIAAAMFVSPHTVRKHMENIFERLDVTSRTAAVARVFG